MNSKLIVSFVALGLLSLRGAAWAEDKEPSIAEQAKAAMDKHGSLSYALPSMPLILMPDVRKKIDLTEEQFKDVQDIGLIFNGKLTDSRQVSWAKEREILEKFSGAEREKALAEFHSQEWKKLEERRKWALDARQQIEKLLTEEQLEKLREEEFKSRTQYILYSPQFFGELELDEDQRKKMKAVQDDVAKQQMELSKKVQDLQRQGSEDLVKLLTPEQRTKLRVVLEKAFGQSMMIK